MRVRDVAAAVVVGVALLGSVSGCSSDDEKTKPKAEPTGLPPSPAEPLPEGKQDGSVPISVVRSFLDQLAKGNGDLACSYLTQGVQDFVVASDGSDTKTCADAVVAVVGAGAKADGPPKFEVLQGTLKSTVLDVHRRGKPSQRWTLRSTSPDVWLISGVVTLKK